MLRDAVHRSAEAQPSLPTPNALFRGLVPALAPAVKDADRQKLETQQQILGYLTGGPLDADASVDFLASLASPEAREKLQKFAPLLAENREELQLFAFQVTQRLVERQATGLKGSIGEGPNHSNHSNHSNSFKIQEFSLEIQNFRKINFNIF